MLPAMDETTPQEDARTIAARSGRRGYVLAGLALVASLLVVFMYWRGAYQRQVETFKTDFIGHSDEMAALMVRRLDSYELVTRGGVSLVASVARPSRQQWQNYVDGLNLRSRFPAMVGLGFAIYATPGQLSAMQRMLRDSGEGMFTVTPHGVRERYGAVLYLGPRSAENISALGYDMYAQPTRHAAMQAARDTGRARLTGRVRLTQDADPDTSSLLLYQPVYRSADRPSSIAARRESMQGWVYVAFRIRPFVDTTLSETLDRSWFRIVDISDGGEQQLYADPPSDDRRAPAFIHQTEVDIHGRRWRFEFHSEPMAVLEQRVSGLRSTLLVGVLASLLLFLIALVLARTRQRAEELAGRMSESYRRSELRFRSAMQYSAIGKALLDRQGRIVESNPALAKVFASTREQLIGRRFDTFFVDAAASEHDALAGTSKVQRITRVLRNDDGVVRHAQLTIAPVPGDAGKEVALLVQVEDITDRLRAQAQVLALNRTLEARVQVRTRDLTRANDELEAFAYSVSHDLRAPLRAIDGFSRLLAERYSDAIDEAGREHIARVRGAAARMGDLIESLLKMARLGRGGIKHQPLDLSGISQEVLSELRAGDPGREVGVEIAPGLAAMGDRGLVYNLLENLIGNAWKFTSGREDARIEIGQNDGGEFFVRDNGAGFVPEYANKLFRPFQRLHSEEQFAGHGIGLASVKRIVERHGGSIRAEGKPGQGATFYFTLPDPSPE